MELNHFEKIQSYLPISLAQPAGFAIAFGVVLFFILIRYFAMVAAFYFWFWRDNSLHPRQLHDQNVKPGQVKFEIKHSMVSSLVFAFFGVLMGLLWQQGLTQIYLRFDHYGYWYLPASFVLISLIHELYFYLTHRWMHIPRVYTRFHHVHHFSRKTSPWASFSFHFNEAIVQAIFLPLVVLLVPVHPVVLISYLTFMTLTAISNHLGVELISSKIITRYFISGDHHSLHHQQFNGNYGLYYCFMDRWFGTEIKEAREKK